VHWTQWDDLGWHTNHGEPPEGPVDLSFAHVSRLDDTAASWPPGNYTLADLTYRSDTAHTREATEIGPDRLTGWAGALRARG
jgi:hypothetical protein